MNGINLLCDTNPLIYMLNGDADIASFLKGKRVNISVITELELFGKQNLSARDKYFIDILVEKCFVENINNEIKAIYKRLKNVYSIQLPDAIIAATAIYLDVPLFTFDKIFEKIPELELLIWEY